MIDSKELEQIVRYSLELFYQHRLDKIKKLRLRHVLRRKNPYLFRALANERAGEIVGQIMAAHLSSSDETMFGNDFFEPLARLVSGGKVSEAKGVDLTIETDAKITAYAIKSGANALNASALQKQRTEFSELRSRLYKIQKQFDPVLGAAYGNKNLDPSTSRDYRILSGQKFWQELTGDSEFYIRIIDLMRDAPKIHRDFYKSEWDAAMNRLTSEFMADSCFPDGHINWQKMVAFVSAEKLEPAPKKRAKGGIQA